MFKLFKNIGLAILVIAAIFLFEISKARGADLTTQFAESSTDMWWDPSQDGMGVALKSQNGTVFGAWYNYSPDNRPSFLTFADKVKSDANGRETVVTNLYRTFGPPPKNFAPPVTANAVGSVMLTWAGPGNIILEFTFTDSGTTQTGRMSLVRFQLGADTSGALHYTDKVVALWTDGYPFMVTRTSVTRVVNTTTDVPISCGIASRVLASGHVLVKCAVTGLPIGTLRTYAIDPTNGRLAVFSAAVPDDITFTVVEANSTAPVVGTTSARVSGGWYYADPIANWHLLFQAENGGAPVMVKEGTFEVDRNLKVLRSYSN